MQYPRLFKPKPELDTSYYRMVLNLVGQPTPRIRGDWWHYQCPACDDHSRHLGINQVIGAFKCLRCGLSGKLTAELTSTAYAKPKFTTNKAVEEAMLTFDQKRKFVLDAFIHKYMEKRGLPDPKIGWAYGRKNLSLRVVFPCYGITGHLTYLQHRTVMEGKNQRYMSDRRLPVPRLDFSAVLGGTFPSSVLILVEGPIDALMVRSLTGVWAAPLYGTSLPGKPYLGDLSDAVDMFNMRKVVVWLDSEKMAENRSMSLARTLKSELGIQTASLSWPELDGRDPNDIKSVDTMIELIKGYI